MKRAILMASTAIAMLTLPALADGASKHLVGLADFGYDYTDYDGLDDNAFHAKGSALWKLDGNWNIQGNFGFNTDRFDLPGLSTRDTWKIGGTAFWRDLSQGAIGGELFYQSLDMGAAYDGVGIAGQGEFYLSPQATIGARIGYTTLSRNSVDLDKWSYSAAGHYYLQPDLGLKLGFAYSNLDTNGGEGSDEWSLRGEGEYLFDDCDTSLYAAVSFGNLEPEVGPGSLDSWGIGLGLRLYLGTSGDLAQRHRTGTLEDLDSPRVLVF